MKKKTILNLFILILAFNIHNLEGMRIITNSKYNEYGGKIINIIYEPLEKENRLEGIKEEIIFLDSKGTNRKKILLRAKWYNEKTKDFKDIISFNSNGILLKCETIRTDDDILTEGWYKKVAVYNRSGFPESVDYFFIPEYSKREYVSSIREFYDPQGKIVEKIIFFTPEYTIRSGAIKERIRFYPFLENFTFYSNTILLKRGISLIIESYAQKNSFEKGELLWKEFYYSKNLSTKTGIEKIRRNFNKSGRVSKDEITFTKSFEEREKIIRAVLEYDDFKIPLKLTTYDNRHKIKSEIYGKKDISKFFGKKISLFEE